MARSWHLTGPAFEDMQRIMGSGHPEAQAQLQAYVDDILERSKEPKELEDGRLQYRSGKPHRCRIICEPGPPVRVVQVLPDHAGREGAYQKSFGGASANEGHKERRNQRFRQERADDERWLRLVDLEQLSATELESAIEADPAAVDRLLQYLDDRGELTDRQWDARILSRDILGAVAGRDGREWGRWRSGERDFPLSVRRCVIWAAWGEPAK